MNNSISIGLYHPQLMNRVAIVHLLNAKLSNRVKHVSHLFDLFSSNFSIIVLIEPEILSVKYNPELISSFISSVSKPVIVVPFYERDNKPSANNVIFMKQNPKTGELVECIRRIEDDLYGSKKPT